MAPDNPAPGADPDQLGLSQRLRWLIAFRIVFAGVLVIATLIWRPGEGDGSFLSRPFLAVLFVTSAHFAVSILFFIMDRIRAIGWLKAFALIQILWDLIFTTSLVAVTGGLNSDLKGLYWLTIATAAILLFRFGAFFAALLSSLMYGVILNLELFGLIAPLFNVVAETSVWKGDQVWHSVVWQTVIFFAVAQLFSMISTRLRKAETALVEKSADLEDLEALMGRIVESITSGLATLNSEGYVRFWSRTAEEITGLRQEEVRGKPLREIFPEVAAILKKTTRAGQVPRSGRWEAVFSKGEQGTRTLGFSLSPLRHGPDGEPGMLLLFEDLTDYREMQEQVKRADRLAAVGELAARIAHEIRNPLTSVSGSIEVLKTNRQLNERDRRLMEIVVRETDRLNQLLTDFLQFARPTAAQLEEVMLDHLLKETAELFSRSHGHDSLKLRLELAPDVQVQADPRQLNQMFWNLIKNASEAMPQGGEIRVVLSEDSDGDGISIEVHDTGPGIPPEVRDRIFTPFFTTKTRGTGLGLAMVRRIAEEHGGTVAMENGIRRGAIFKVHLPKTRVQMTAVETANP